MNTPPKHLWLVCDRETKTLYRTPQRRRLDADSLVDIITEGSSPEPQYVRAYESVPESEAPGEERFRLDVPVYVWISFHDGSPGHVFTSLSEGETVLRGWNVRANLHPYKCVPFSRERGIVRNERKQRQRGAL